MRSSVGGAKLPAAFVREMQELFEKLPGVSVSELPAFLECLSGERSYGLRRNPFKYTKEEFEERIPFSLESVPWAEDGYFYKKEEQPGKSPYHEAGAFYMQEPSAMIVAELLGGKPGERIADLCAAPGGKSTQIAGKMQGKGLLVCNEYVPARAKILAQNMERMGVAGCVIFAESVDRLADRFPLFFDRVLVDAPCSGEGMFRKEEQALLQWSPENVAMCAKRQKEILEEAARLVRPDGVLVYSTCTFSEAEDEAVIREFLNRHEEFCADESVLSAGLAAAGVCPGGLPGTVRMWPHRLCGEGHFAAKLLKRGAAQEAYPEEAASRRETSYPDAEIDKRKRNLYGQRNSGRSKRTGKQYEEGRRGGEKGSEQEKWNLFHNFCEQYLSRDYRDRLEDTGRLAWRKDSLFLVPEDMPEPGGLRTERSGLYLGEAKKGRFEPSHTWAMTLKKENVSQCMELEEPVAYLRGEMTENNGDQGWILMLFQGKPLGWGKAGGNVVKNHYPKGLRRM